MDLPSAIKADVREHAREYIGQVKAAQTSRPDARFRRDYMSSPWNMFFRKGEA